MPQIGERKTVGNVTGEWDGQGWVQVSDPAAAQPASAPAPQSAISRFLGGAISHSPLGGIYSMLTTDPRKTIGGLVQSGLLDPMAEGINAGRSALEAVQGGENGRIIPALEALKHTAGVIPFFGKSMTASGEKIGQGDVAGGLGELAGTASYGLVPEMAQGLKKGPGALKAAARTVAPGLETAGEHLGSPVIQGSAIGGSLMHGNLPGAAAAVAVPPMMRAAGRGLRKFAGEAPETPPEPIPVPPGLGMGYDPSVFETPAEAAPSAAQQQLAALNALRQRMTESAPPTATSVQMDPRTTMAFDRGRQSFFEDPELQARRRQAIDAIMNLDSFKGIR